MSKYMNRSLKEQKKELFMYGRPNRSIVEAEAENRSDLSAQTPAPQQAPSPSPADREAGKHAAGHDYEEITDAVRDAFVAFTSDVF